MTYCREAYLVKRSLRTTKYEIRTTFDQSRMSAQESLG